MRRLCVLGAAFAALVLLGCGSSSPSDDTTVKSGSGEAMNPGGKPKTEQEAAMQSAMEKQGNAMNDARGQAATAEAAAKAKTGGK